MRKFAKLSPSILNISCKEILNFVCIIAKRCINKRHCFTITLKELLRILKCTGIYWKDISFYIAIQKILDEAGFYIRVKNRTTGVVEITQKELAEYVFIWSDMIKDVEEMTDNYTPLKGLLTDKERRDILYIPDGLDDSIKKWLSNLSLYDLSAYKSEIGAVAQERKYFKEDDDFVQEIEKRLSEGRSAPIHIKEEG